MEQEVSQEAAPLRYEYVSSELDGYWAETQYLQILEQLVSKARAGKWQGNRTGVRTVKLVSQTIQWPAWRDPGLLMTKRIHTQSVLRELEWFVRGETNVLVLNAHGVRIWDEWADKHGNLGPIYGAQWRGKGTRHGVDQLMQMAQSLRDNPNDRRMIVSSWQLSDMVNPIGPRMGLPPCHHTFQAIVDDDDRVCLEVMQRSGDCFLGIPFNMASYTVLLHMLAWIAGRRVGHVTHHIADCHLYENHVDVATEQLTRPMPAGHPVRFKMSVDALQGEDTSDRTRVLDLLKYGDLSIEGYTPLPTIKAKVAV